MAGIIIPFDIRDNKLWEPDRPRTKLEAWIDLSILAQSESVTSERKLADRWKWPKTNVRRFITELTKVDHILDQKRTGVRLTELALCEFSGTKNGPQNGPPKFADDCLEMTVSKYILKKITEVNPGFKTPNLQSWCKDVDLILRLDGRDKDELREVIDWTYKDDFWRNVILSPAKLRKQYDQLNTKRLAQAKASPKPQQQPTAPSVTLFSVDFKGGD